MTNTGGLRVLYLNPRMLQGFKLDYFHSQTTGICGIGQIIGGGGVTDRPYLGRFLLMVECDPIVSGYIWF